MFVCQLPSCWTATRSYLISNYLLICTSTSCIVSARFRKCVIIRMTPYCFVAGRPLKRHKKRLEHGALVTLQFNLINLSQHKSNTSWGLCLPICNLFPPISDLSTYVKEECSMFSACRTFNKLPRTRHPCMFLAVFLPSAFNRSHLNISRCESRNRCKVVLKPLPLTEGFSFCM